MTSEKIVTIQRGRGAWQGPESKAPRAPMMCNDAAQLAALGADMGNHISGDLISRDAALAAARDRHIHWAALGGACLVDDDISACADIAEAIRALPAQPAPAPARKIKALVADLNAIADKRHVGNNKTLTIADADRIADAARILSALEYHA